MAFRQLRPVRVSWRSGRKTFVIPDTPHQSCTIIPVGVNQSHLADPEQARDRAAVRTAT